MINELIDYVTAHNMTITIRNSYVSPTEYIIIEIHMTKGVSNYGNRTAISKADFDAMMFPDQFIFNRVKEMVEDLEDRYGKWGSIND